MKNHVIKRLFRIALVSILLLRIEATLRAQTFTVLHAFSALTNSTNVDGSGPQSTLVVSNNVLYGTTRVGGAGGAGTIFKINTDGSGFSNLYNFTTPSGSPLTNSDGGFMENGVILSSNILYGTARLAGPQGKGTIFSLNADGSGFTNLHGFTGGHDGANPFASMILSSNVLYGTALFGGDNGDGDVFRINTDGSSFTNIHSFTGNNEAFPFAGLVLSSNILYGGTSGFPPFSYGAIFKINTDGSGYQDSYNFTDGNDGAYPNTTMVSSGNMLYGTTLHKGSVDTGTVFSFKLGGTGVTPLHSFTAGSDGAYPFAELVLSNNALFGVTEHGGTDTNGTVYSVNTDSTGFTNYHTFTATSGPLLTNYDGASPRAGLLLFSNVLYGVAMDGGAGGGGTIFSISLQLVNPPSLTMSWSGTNLVLSWPMNFNWYALQSTTNLDSSDGWTDMDPQPSPVDGEYALTNSMSATQQFFRLIQKTPN